MDISYTFFIFIFFIKRPPICIYFFSVRLSSRWPLSWCSVMVLIGLNLSGTDVFLPLCFITTGGTTSIYLDFDENWDQWTESWRYFEEPERKKHFQLSGTIKVFSLHQSFILYTVHPNNECPDFQVAGVTHFPSTTVNYIWI